MFRFKLAEFFSGPGGMAYGAGLSKVRGSTIEHAWASDYDQDSCKTYKRNIKTKAIFCEKVENFFNLVDKKKIILPKFDCFAYGFPCNDFSNVGEHLGFKGKFGPLYTYGVELINRYHPTWFVAENVGGQPEQAAGNSAMHPYNTDVLAEADFASDDETEAFVRDGKDMPRYHRRDERNTKAPWYHFVVCRDATLATNNLVFYWNGKKKLFATDSTNYPLTHPFLKIGAQYVATNCLSGWMDNFRVTKGICRYDVTQDTITVPTEDFPEF